MPDAVVNPVVVAQVRPLIVDVLQLQAAVAKVAVEVAVADAAVDVHAVA